MTTDRPSASEITDDQLDRLYAELDELRTAPLLRTCLYPTCLRQMDIGAALAGRTPTRPEWCAVGWHTVQRGVATGHVCPSHTSAVTAHAGTWRTDLPDGQGEALCGCGWRSGVHRWQGALRGLWEEHLLAATAAEVIGE